ncbi:predicted protein [Chaetoceros tenuissimus]|uniref:Uncharacterized protein n=1 Tax=Chaetoceros tenuissimus TaxID=426638 RepID=A0AAD3CGW6_9STRA|nr:predicted protein [Chaetoceros tenuissimus]
MAIENKTTTTKATTKAQSTHRSFNSSKRKKRNLFPKRFKIFQRRSKEKVKTHKTKAYRCESPTRSMPHEIHVQECQGSPMSQISGTTGLDPLPFMRKNGQSMMSSKLPPLLQPRYEIGEDSVFSHSTENESMNSLFQKDEYVFRPKRFFAMGGRKESATFTIEKKSNSLCRQLDADFKRGEKFNFINYILGSAKFQRMLSEVLSIVAKNPDGVFTKEQVYCALLLCN